VTGRDPIASLAAFPITVTLADVDYTIEAMPASGWLTVMFDPDTTMMDVFPGLLTREQEIEVYDLVDEGMASYEDLLDRGHRILELASGRDYWEAQNIAAVAYGNWELIGGEVALAGLNPEQMSLGAWLDATYLLILRSADKNQRSMVEHAIKQPPMHERAASFDEEAESALFLSQMRAVSPR
jgi:hypothetical protein